MAIGKVLVLLCCSSLAACGAQTASHPSQSGPVSATAKLAASRGFAVGVNYKSDAKAAEPRTILVHKKHRVKAARDGMRP